MRSEVRLVGNLTEDPVIHENEKGKFGRFRLAVNSGKDNDALFVNVKFSNYCLKDVEFWSPVKGDKVVVIGRPMPEKYKRENGTEVESFVIYGDSVLKAAETNAW